MNLVNDFMKADLKDIFPELSEKQMEATLMFSSGMSISEIALFRNVSETSIKRVLRAAMTDFSVFSLNSLRAIVQTRISMFLVRKLSVLATQLQPHTSQHK